MDDTADRPISDFVASEAPGTEHVDPHCAVTLAAAPVDAPVAQAASPMARRPGRKLHPVPVRVMHWANAVVMLVMIGSGWGIYDDDVVIRGLYFGHLERLGDWAATSLQWHFAGMWLLAINGLAYLSYGFITGRLRERMLPIRISELVQTVIDTLHFRIKHEDLTTYNAVQKLLYIIVISAGVSQVVTGLAIWKPVQFSQLVSLLGGFQTARLIHFTGMTVIVGFLVVHVALSLLVPSTLWAMLTGGPRLDRSRLDRSRHERPTPPVKNMTEEGAPT